MHMTMYYTMQQKQTEQWTRTYNFNNFSNNKQQQQQKRNKNTTTNTNEMIILWVLKRL